MPKIVLISMLVLPFLVMSSLTAGYGDIPDWIAASEQQNSLSSEDRFRLGQAHFFLGGMYHSAHRGAAHIGYQLLLCEALEQAAAIDRTLIGVRCALDLGWADSALSLLSAISPASQKDIQEADNIRAIAEAQSQDIAIEVSQSGPFEVQLERVYFAYRQRLGSGLRSSEDVVFSEGAESDTHVALLTALVDNDIDKLREVVRAYDVGAAAPAERDASPDLKLLLLLSHAHYRIAIADFRQAVPDLESNHRSIALRNAARAAVFLRSDSQLSKILGQGDIPELIPYVGLHHLWSGDDERARQTWMDVAADPVNWKAAAELLFVWHTVQEFHAEARELSARCIASLGNMKQQSQLKKSDPERLYAIYSETARLLIASAESMEDYDSASYLYFMSNTVNEAVSLRTHSPDFCTLYFVARSLSIQQYLVQEGYQGLLEMEREYPILGSLVHELALYQACRMKGSYSK